MFPSVTEIQYFIEVAQSLNLTRAAERLGVTQPTLSMALRRLEESLGASVLIRKKTGVELTRVGTKFQKEALILLEQWKKVADSAKRDTHTLRGRYTLGAHPSVATYALPESLSRLMVQNPELEFQLVHDLSRRITEQVVRGSIDLAIVVNPLPHPDLVIRGLGSDRVTLWKSSKKKTPNVLIYDPELQQSLRVITQARKLGIHFEREIHSGSLEVIKSLTLAGAGVGILPSRVAQTIEAGLLPYRSNGPEHHDSICLVYRKELRNTESGRALVQAIQQLPALS